MMSADALDDLPGDSVSEVCHCFEVSEKAANLLRADLTSGVYLGLLIDQELFKDALRFMAYSLSKRQVVWWGCLCVWETLRPEVADEKLSAALEATVRWVRRPSEEHRRAAEVAGKSAKVRSPAGAMAMAAFWSGGSMSRPGLPEVEPDLHLTAKTVAGAVVNATKQHGKAQTSYFSSHFLSLGLDVAAGHNRWNDQ